MLCIAMKPGDYFTVGEDTIVQFNSLNGDRARLTVHAPKEVPILRGKVLEREGGQRPECLQNVSPRKKPRYRADAVFRWNSDRERAVSALEKLAACLEEGGSAEEAGVLREQISQLVPSVWEDELIAKSFSPG